jgi:aspartyl protease family protein
MDQSDTMRLIYLTVLLVAVVGSYLVQNRSRMGQVAQQAAIWGLIFVGFVAAYGLWGDMTRNVLQREAVQADGTVDLPKAPDGHFYLSAVVNGQRIRFVVDTGASQIVLTQGDARKAGFNPATLSFTDRAMTANGMVLTAPVSLQSLEFAGFRDEGVSASVNGGDLDTSLLGMSYLKRYRMTLDGDTLTLAR